MLFDRSPGRLDAPVAGQGDAPANTPGDTLVNTAGGADSPPAPAVVDGNAAVAASPQAVPAAQVAASAPQSDGITAGAVISAELGHAFLLRRPEAWRITAGLFGRTFAHAPNLMLRLYAAEDAENLCRLGRILEKAAPCVGAERLTSAAHAVQWAINGADAGSVARTVEECVLALREVLDALEGQPSAKERRPSV